MAFGTLGRAVLELSANTGKFTGDIGRAAAMFGRSMERMRRSIGNMVGGFAAYFSGRMMFRFIKDQIDLADATAKMSQKLGISTEALSSYMTAASLAGVQTKQLQIGLQQLAKNQADLALGTGDALYAFNALGLGLEDFQRLNGDTAAMFELVAKNLAQYEDGANKTAIAMKIFGKSGAEMIPLFNSLEKTRNEAEELGLVIGGPVAKAAEDFNDEMNRAGRAASGLGLKIAADLLPVMTKLAEALTAFVKDGQEVTRISAQMETGFKLMATAGIIISSAFELTGKRIAGVARAIWFFVKGDWSEAWTTAKNVFEDQWDGMKGIVQDVQNVWAEVARAAPAAYFWEDALLGVKKQAPALKDTAKAAREAAAAAKKLEAALKGVGLTSLVDVHRKLVAFRKELVGVSEAAGDFANAFEEPVEELNEAILEVGESSKKTKDFANTMGNVFVSAFEDAILNGEEFSEVLKALEKDIARIILRMAITEPLQEGIKGIDFGSIFSTAISAFGNSGGGGGTAVMSSGTAFSGGVGGLQLAEGGRPPVGVASLVGEKGPEMFVPDVAGSIVPNDKLGGGGTYYIDARGADSEGMRQLRALIERINGSVEPRAVSAVANARRRGLIPA